MPKDVAPKLGKTPADPEWKIAIVRSLWHGECTAALQESAIATLLHAGIKRKNILCVDVPGSFEIPLAVQQTFTHCGVDGAIAFGVIVQGETHHAELVANQAAAGLMQVQLKQQKPVTFEILFVDHLKDAVARSIGKESKGRLAAMTLLSSLATNRKIH